ncbi:MAG TPA: hypothetical protein VF476_13640 [Chitinophagaceae bacterium]
MKKNLVSVLSISLLMIIAATGCSKKGGGGGNNPPAEAPLAVTLNPATGSTQPPDLGPNFPLTVTITSTMPTQGVKIEVTAIRDDGSGTPAFFSTNVNSSTAANNFSITNTPPGIICLVTVKVTSRSTATNTWTGTYRYSKKP